MPQENIRYVLVWSGWLRLSHWLIATGVLFQLASAWAIKLDEVNYAFWLDWHIISGQIILLALALRLILLFIPVSSKSPGSSNWRAFIPERSQLQAMLQMVKFYISLARFPLPNWYAHNPFWLPVYPVLFIILAGCAISGLLYNSPQLVFGQPMDELHGFLAGLIIMFSIFHIIAVFLHDLKGKGAYISAMINGYRYFHYSGKNAGQENLYKNKQSENTAVHVSVDSIKKSAGK